MVGARLAARRYAPAGLTRRPVAVALLGSGLLAVGGGTGGLLLLLNSHPGTSPRPVAHPGPASARYRFPRHRNRHPAPRR